MWYLLYIFLIVLIGCLSILAGQLKENAALTRSEMLYFFFMWPYIWPLYILIKLSERKKK